MLLVALVLLTGVGGRSVQVMGRGCVSVEAGNVLDSLGCGGGRRVGFSSVKKSAGRQGVGGRVARLAVVVVVLSGTWRGAGAAACTGSKCCNVVIPKLSVATTKILSGVRGGSTCDGSTTCGECSEGACTLFAT